MADDRTVLDHLLEARDALAGEVARLNEAIEQLDLVLARIGSVDRSLTGGLAAGSLTRPAATTGATVTAPVTREPVNRQADLETGAAVSVPSRRRGGAGRGPAKKAVTRSRRPGEAPKSIRVHVLDMLAEENREFGLAEIIERVHDAGIQAHDDAVRSITIKLMKDGRVERVGRGQYRLARRGAGARSGAATAPGAAEPEAPGAAEAEAPRGAEADTDSSESADGSTQDTFADLSQDDSQDDSGEGTLQDTEQGTAQHAAPSGVEEHGDSAESDAMPESADEPAQQPSEQQPSEQFPGEQPWGGYTPPLNLGQPWQS